MPLPTPPIKSMGDFIVFAFVTIVTLILLSSAAGLLYTVIFTDRDVSAWVSVMADITMSLVSALIGFLAGKGQGRMDVDQERREQALKKKESE